MHSLLTTLVFEAIVRHGGHGWQLGALQSAGDWAVADLGSCFLRTLSLLANVEIQLLPVLFRGELRRVVDADFDRSMGIHRLLCGVVKISDVIMFQGALGRPSLARIELEQALHQSLGVFGQAVAQLVEPHPGLGLHVLQDFIGKRRLPGLDVVGSRIARQFEDSFDLAHRGRAGEEGPAAVHLAKDA